MLEPHPLGNGRWLTLWKYASPHLFYPANFGHSWSSCTSVINRDLPKNLVLCLSRSFSVIGTNTDWLAAIDFLWLTYSNMDLSRTVFVINGHFCQKSHFFPTHVCLMPQWGSFPWNFRNMVALKKLVVPLPDDGQFDDTWICFDTIHECDRQTNRFAITISHCACIGMLTHDKIAGCVSMCV